MDSMYIDNLDEFINDEKRIVSYKWLSLTLNVSSNVAKQMLYEYVEKQKKAKENGAGLTVTYLVSGIHFETCGSGQDVYKICIVRDSDLAKIKSSLKKIISVHIYSIQKALLKDLNILYTANYDKVKEDVFQSTCHSSITCPGVHLRTDEEMSKLKKELPAVNSKKPSSPLKIKFEPPQIPQKISNENKENKFDGNIKPKEEVQRTGTAGKEGIANLFSKQLQQQKLETKISRVKSKNGSAGPISKKPEAKKGMLSTFFTKVQPKDKLMSPKKEVCPELPLEENLKVKEEERDIDSVEVKLEEVSPPKVVTSKKAPVKNNSSSKGSKKKCKPIQKGKRKSDCEDPLENLKRRRIMVFDSSSGSESEDGNDDIDMNDECPLLETPPTTVTSDEDDEVIPATPQDSASVNAKKLSKSRKKKMVDKTFTDDKGYFVTKKEYVLVSDSDEENPISSVKEVSPMATGKKEKVSPKLQKVAVKKDSPKKNKRSPAKTKQSSIMNFFKKI